MTRLDNVGEADSDEEPVTGLGDESERGLGQNSQGALGADEGSRQVEAFLRHEVLERVTGDLTLEPSELRAKDGKMLGNQRLQRRDPVIEAAHVCAAFSVTDRELVTAPRDQRQTQDVVGCATVAEGP